MWTVDSLRRHVEEKFSQAEILTSPFPHLTITDFFPDDVYEQIRRNNLFELNEGTLWKTTKIMKGEKVVTPYDHRLQINFHADDPYAASDEGRELWGKIRDAFLTDDWFTKLVYSKYPDYFAIRFGDAMEQPDFWSHTRQELFLQRHEVGYYIGPHTDVPSRIFTCIFAFADRPGFEEYGTQLLNPKDPLVRCWGNDHHDFEDFELRKTAPYSPNHFLLFFKTRQSFHAVPTITRDVPDQRWGMQFQCYEPYGGMFRDLSHPDLMRTKLQANTLTRRVARAVASRLRI